ncbi:hypothetical protein [Endozoicomonas sp. Mp262]|uniref:hypothetical protein n=1 Tax=Endozoicomonas sp. Mp262 TaxID=2919499 RepID=UPI0021D7F130
MKDNAKLIFVYSIRLILLVSLQPEISWAGGVNSKKSSSSVVPFRQSASHGQTLSYAALVHLLERGCCVPKGIYIVLDGNKLYHELKFKPEERERLSQLVTQSKMAQISLNSPNEGDMTPKGRCQASGNSSLAKTKTAMQTCSNRKGSEQLEQWLEFSFDSEKLAKHIHRVCKNTELLNRINTFSLNSIKDGEVGEVLESCAQRVELSKAIANLFGLLLYINESKLSQSQKGEAVKEFAGRVMIFGYSNMDALKALEAMADQNLLRDANIVSTEYRDKIFAVVVNLLDKINELFKTELEAGSFHGGVAQSTSLPVTPYTSFYFPAPNPIVTLEVCKDFLIHYTKMNLSLGFAGLRTFGKVIGVDTVYDFGLSESCNLYSTLACVYMTDFIYAHLYGAQEDNPYYGCILESETKSNLKESLTFGVGENVVSFTVPAAIGALDLFFDIVGREQIKQITQEDPAKFAELMIMHFSKFQTLVHFLPDAKDKSPEYVSKISSCYNFLQQPLMQALYAVFSIQSSEEEGSHLQKTPEDERLLYAKATMTFNKPNTMLFSDITLPTEMEQKESKTFQYLERLWGKDHAVDQVKRFNTLRGKNATCNIVSLIRCCLDLTKSDDLSQFHRLCAIIIGDTM